MTEKQQRTPDHPQMFPFAARHLGQPSVRTGAAASENCAASLRSPDFFFEWLRPPHSYRAWRFADLGLASPISACHSRGCFSTKDSSPTQPPEYTGK